MPDSHPKHEEVAQLVAGFQAGARKTLEHLLTCAACRELATELLAGGRGGDLCGALATVLPWREPERDYAAVIDRALGEFERRHSDFQREHGEAERALAGLLALPEEERVSRVAADPRLRSWALTSLILEESRDTALKNPQAAESLALLAVAVAERLEPSRYSKTLLEDLRSMAWGRVANSRRIASDLRGADEAFQLADHHFARGTRNPLEKAQLFDLKSSLRRAQRRFGEASRLLNRAIVVYREIGEDHLTGRALMKLAKIEEETGRLDQAIRLLGDSIQLIDTAREPRLGLLARHNLIAYLTDSGRYMEAQALISRSRPLYQQFRDADPQSVLRLHWVRGRIARGLGRLAEAERCFLAARQGFLAHGIAYDVALISLELALVYAEQGRGGEMQRVAVDTLPIFESIDVERETLAALLLLRQATALQQLTAEVVERTLARLESDRRRGGRGRSEPIL